MIEMLGVLAIVGVLSAGGIAGYSMAMQSHKTNSTIEKVNLLANRIRTLYKNGDCTGLNNNELLRSGKVSAEDLKNPFGGNFSIGKSGWGSGEAFRIALNESNVPAEACVDFMMTDWGNSGVFEGIHVKNVSGTEYIFRHKNSTWPPSAAEAITACAGGSDALFHIVFK